MPMLRVRIHRQRFLFAELVFIDRMWTHSPFALVHQYFFSNSKFSVRTSHQHNHLDNFQIKAEESFWDSGSMKSLEVMQHYKLERDRREK